MSTLSDLEDAIRAHLQADDEHFAHDWPLVGWVLYTAQADAGGDNLSATGIHIPEGQPYYVTLGLLHSAVNEADNNSITQAPEDDD
jgi:hypothetical protein